MGLFDFVRDTVDQFRYPEQYPEAWSKAYKQKKIRKENQTDEYWADYYGTKVVFFGDWFKQCAVSRGSLELCVRDALSFNDIHHLRSTLIRLNFIHDGLISMKWVADGKLIRGKALIRMDVKKVDFDDELNHVQHVLNKAIRQVITEMRQRGSDHLISD